MNWRRPLVAIGAVVVAGTALTTAWILRIATGTATPRFWLIAELRAEVEAIPESDRAWPIYRAAIGALHQGRSDTYDYEPRDREQWPTYRDWLRQQRTHVDAIVAATRRPHLGLPWGTPELWRVGATPPVDPTQDFADEQAVVAAGPMRDCYRVLRSDAYLALEDGDIDRALGSLEACVRFTAQCARARHPLVLQLTSGAIASGVRSVAAAFLSDARLHTPERLERLDAILALLPSEAMRYGEALPFELETLSAFYTPDGWGGGRLTAEAIDAGRRVRGFRTDVGLTNKDEGRDADAPALAIQLFGPTLAEAERRLAEMSKRLDECTSQPAHMRPPLGDVLPPPLRFESAVASLATLRDGDRLLLIGDFGELGRDAMRFAATLLRRRIVDGAWPDPRDPAAPTDPITGTPLRWTLRDGTLLVYALGNDRVDDGGIEPTLPAGVDPPSGWNSYFAGDDYRDLKGDIVIVRVPLADLR